MSWIQTYNSHKFFPAEPEHEENVIDIEDISHALSMLCRFNGHCHVFYSVAQHCSEVADLIWKETHNAELALWGLLHDAAEAYISDIPKPIKAKLTGYGEMEEPLLKVIVEHFGLSWPQPEIVDKYDLIMLRTEQEWLMGAPPDDWGFTGPESLPVFPNLIRDPGDAKTRFMMQFEKLTKMIETNNGTKQD
jgi:hypothetical protein